jgi:hypothetical protein
MPIHVGPTISEKLCFLILLPLRIHSLYKITENIREISFTPPFYYSGVNTSIRIYTRYKIEIIKEFG